ncbi:hypothetical protein MHYP_G00001210 [Metynnis hypsauchen]
MVNNDNVNISNLLISRPTRLLVDKWPEKMKLRLNRSRGRGKAVVDDEDSVDGMETAESGGAQEPGYGVKVQQICPNEPSWWISVIPEVVDSSQPRLCRRRFVRLIVLQMFQMASSSLVRYGKGQPEDGEGSAAVSSLCGEEEEQPSSSPVSPRSDAGEAETSAASGGAQSSEQLCALCHCGARSLLGQGELKLFKATPGFEARTEGRSHDDRSAAASQSGRSRGPER